MHGPDVASKSIRTQYRYATEISKQKTLNPFFHMEGPSMVIPARQRPEPVKSLQSENKLPTTGKSFAKYSVCVFT